MGSGGTSGASGAGGPSQGDGAVGGGGVPGAGGKNGGGPGGSGGAPRAGGAGGMGGTSASGGRTGGQGAAGMAGSGGAIRTGGVEAAGGRAGTGGKGATGGVLGSGGMGGKGGSAGSSGIFGMPCTTNQDCPSDAICCDGSTPGCDGTRLPSGDGADPGELVIGADGLTTTDTITGLVWQRDGSSARAGCDDPGGQNCTWDEAQAYCTSLVLDGVSGWRLPAWMELLTISDLTTSNAAPDDSTPFPNPGTYWTSSVYPPVYGGALSLELYVSADGTSGFCRAGLVRSARCVRGSRCYPTSRFVVLGDGAVRDTLTGLVWQQQGSSTAMSWADAQIYCSSLLSGFRLPTLKELDSLLDPTAASGPTLDKAFADTGGAKYWTSSPYAGPYADAAGDARYGDFYVAGANNCEGGGQNWAPVASKLMVRCVH